MSKHRRSYSRSLTIPLAPIAGLGAGLAIPIQRAMAGNYTGPDSALDWLAYNFTGLYGVSSGNPTFNIEGLKNGLLPLVAGLLIHKFVGGKPLNANAALARAGVPIIRI